MDGNAERQPFHGGGDGARVEHVLAHVLPVIDAAQDEVGPLVEQRLDSEHHAVGRRAIDLPAPLGAPHRTQRMMQRERMTGGALLAVRRDDGDFAQRLGRFDEALDAVREDAVVVGDEKAHQRPRGRRGVTFPAREIG